MTKKRRRRTQAQIKAQERKESILQVLKIALPALAILVIAISISRINYARYFPIKTVKVFGANHVDHDTVAGMIEPLVSNGFFSVKVDNIKEELSQLPWVAHVSVRRVWPSRVDITLIEKKVVAKWNNASLLTAGGELFQPQRSTYPSHAPVLWGPDGSHNDMLKMLSTLNKAIDPINAKVTVLELSPSLSWRMILDNGLVLRLGNKDVLTRLNHFVKVYSKVIGKHEKDVDYVDLRYANGMAVRWKKNRAKT